jgi:hypothetical protein
MRALVCPRTSRGLLDTYLKYHVSYVEYPHTYIHTLKKHMHKRETQETPQASRIMGLIYASRLPPDEHASDAVRDLASDGNSAAGSTNSSFKGTIPLNGLRQVWVFEGRRVQDLMD